MENLKHIMVDLETLGTKSDSVIVSIGAVQFDMITGELGNSVEIEISLESAVENGLRMDTSTVLWWMKQGGDAREKMTIAAESGLDLISALKEFDSFVKSCGDDCEIWGNSARFDLGLLEDAYVKVRLPIPWKFRNERCVRTLVSLAPSIRDSTKFEGTPHYPVDDCKHQIRYCSAIWNSINLK